MKLYFRAEKKDVIAFAVVCGFMLYLVAVLLLNFQSILNDGVPHGLNPIQAFFPSNIGKTFIFWLISVGFLFGSTSSYFFSREKGFGFTSEKKEDGYSRWAKADEIKNAAKVEKVPYVDKQSKYGGVPLVYDKDSAFVDNGESHTMVVGATGSGKTAGIINPTMKMLMKARESIIVSDPKGEIYEDNSGLLRELGYEIIVLNFRDPQKGNCWNPYHLPYKFQKEGNFDKANELLNDLSTNIVVDGQGNDPFWQDSAASYLTGLSLALFEDAESEEQININSVNLMMTQGEDRYGASNYLKEYFNAKDPASPACVNALGTVNAPNETKGGIVSVLKQKVKTLAVTKNLSEMLSKNDFEMDTIGEKPTAVFMIIQDEKTTYHALSTIFVKQCYESLISVAHKHGGSLPVRVNFLLDEFANMPKFKDITTMVTAARSRKIRFLFIIQNFAQIKEKYGDHEAETIRGNCANLIYLLTGELAALEEISKLCGDKLVRVGKDKKEETRPLVTISELQRMKPDEIVLIKHRCPPFKGKLKMDYETDFGFGKGNDHYGKNVIYPEREMTEVKTFDIKEFVRKQKEEKLKEAGLDDNASNPFAGNPFGGSAPFPFPGAPSGEMDIDKMIKEIDAKIAELEKEEEEEKKKQQAMSNTIDNSKEEIVLNPIEEEKQEEQAIKTRPVNTPDGSPKVDEIVHSNMVNFENFSMKQDPKVVEEKTQLPDEDIDIIDDKNEKIDNKDYDDFFDDFFFDE
ncbi:MAG: type IV secretory system conjugative DNA transfer family protein [Bacilli bacterium]|nr:type IV secretory system conjugative DNA transfer family protein [Bacilli bacterium]